MRSSVAKVLFCGICLSLVGCFSAHHCNEKILLHNTDLSQSIHEAAATGSFVGAEEGPTECWWEMFQDPQLNRLVEIGIACNPNLKVAQARIDLAYQGAIEARSPLLPYVDGIASFNRQKESLYDIGLPAFVPLVEGDNLYFNTATALLRASYEIDLWGKNRNTYYASLGRLQADIADHAQARLTLTASIVESYFNLQNHLHQLNYLAKQIEAKQAVTDLLYQRFYRGVDDEFFLYIFDNEVAQLEDSYGQLLETIESDKHALSALVGNVASCSDRSGEISVAMVACYDAPVQLPCTLPMDFLKRRPDVMAALWTIQSKAFEIKVAKAHFFPNLDLTANFGSAAFLISKFFTKAATKWSAEADSTLPIYTGGELMAQLGQAQAHIEIAVEQYNQTLLTAVQDVEDALSSLWANDLRLTKIKDAVHDSEALFNLTNEKYEHGVDSRVKALNAQANVYSQKVLESQIKLDQMHAIVGVIRSIGGGYSAG